MTQDFSARYEPCTAALYQVSFGVASMSLTIFFFIIISVTRCDWDNAHMK